MRRHAAMKLMIVDDHPVVRAGLATLLGQSGPDTSVLQAADVEEAFALLRDFGDIDLLVLDFVMPGLSGLEAIAEFGRRHPDLPLIVLSASEDPRDARRAIAQGALGYVPKSASQHTLNSAIELVLNGQIYVPSLILNDIRSSTPEMGEAAPTERQLTQRQIEVLRLLGEGQSNKVIAYSLDLSEKTVKVHITGIFRALGVVNRTQAAGVGRAKGLI